jgi:GT2 family glycosyltransferase
MKLSVVIATYNRGRLLIDLLADLSAQVDAGPFEVVLVDDGSREPVAPLVQSRDFPYPLRLITQGNTGQARARHRGVLAAEGDVIVITDDDMKLPSHFLKAHRAQHEAGADVVLGLMKPAEDLAKKPLFERFHAAQLALFRERVRRGEAIPGSALCTGNVSFRRAQYLTLGGFDPDLERSEDRELGIRLEEAGARFAFSEAAFTWHHSDHTDPAVWRRRAYLYGLYDHRIARKHPDAVQNDPWHFLLLVHPVSRPVLLAASLAPAAAQLLASAAMRTSEQIDRVGLERVALKGATFVYGLEYFRGVGAAYSTPWRTLRGLLAFAQRQWAEGKVAA